MSLTKYGEVDLHLHRLHAHNVGDLAPVARLVIFRPSYERQYILTNTGPSAMGRRHLLVVPIPNDLRLRISTTRSTCELHVLTTLYGFAFGVTLYVRWTGWICGRSDKMRYTKALIRANETYSKAYPDNRDWEPFELEE